MILQSTELDCLIHNNNEEGLQCWMTSTRNTKHTETHCTPSAHKKYTNASTHRHTHAHTRVVESGPVSVQTLWFFFKTPTPGNNNTNKKREGFQFCVGPQRHDRPPPQANKRNIQYFTMCVCCHKYPRQCSMFPIGRPDKRRIRTPSLRATPCMQESTTPRHHCRGVYPLYGHRTRQKNTTTT